MLRLAIVLASVGLFASPAFVYAADPLPKPEVLNFTTRDGVRLKATYYGSNVGKEAIPVVLLPDFRQTRASYDAWAQRLQQGTSYVDGRQQTKKLPSMAVLTVDLRRCGESCWQERGSAAPVELDKSRVSKQDVLAMVTLDMEEVRRFLLKENDAGRLNLNKLSIVGVGMSATVALNWSAGDWSAPPLPSGKQGQDVKSLVLVSPSWSYKGVPIRDALQQPGVQERVSVLLVAGEGVRSNQRDAERIEKLLASKRDEFDDTNWQEKQSVFLALYNTKLQGEQLLNAQGFGSQIESLAAQFWALRVVEQDFPWSKRD